MTKIPWAEKSWNVFSGCTPTSEGCKNCFAKRMAYRLRGRFGYPQDDPFKVTFHPDKLNEPLKWKKPRRIFVVSMGDLFHKEVSFDIIDEIVAIIALCPQHQFLLLTKRPEIMAEYINQDYGHKEDNVYKPGSVGVHRSWPALLDILDSLDSLPDSDPRADPNHWQNGWPLPNVWLGVSVENQKTADERIPILLQIPAAVRFVSVEPMLGDIWLGQFDTGEYYKNSLTGREYSIMVGWDSKEKLDWVICGCEAINGRPGRETKIAWIRNLRDQCINANVPFFLKQMEFNHSIIKMPMLDGQIWDQYPQTERTK